MSKKTPPIKPPSNPKGFRHFIWYFILGLMLISIISTYISSPSRPKEKEFTDFLSDVDSGIVKEVVIKDRENLILSTLQDGSKFQTYYIDTPDLINTMREKNVSIKVDHSDSSWMFNIFVQALLPFLLIAFLWFFIFRGAAGGSSQAFTFGKSRAKSVDPTNSATKKTFADVAGADEAVEELHEIVDFLKAPKKYSDIGAKIPKGVLLMGPPGTGKTLLAKAVAGEANVDFFTISGSDFVEMFVGVGASRVRDLFAKAKKQQPCIIFVDEIDAVGRHRGAGLGGGHDEREQTLNQLLVEMDGFESNETVIVIAATNRPDILDPALLRPGRFDRQIVVDKPDQKGRLDILSVHKKGKKFAKDVDMELISKKTPGFTGADLANLLNESALLAARKNKKTISTEDISDATERIIAGPQKKSKLLSEKEKQIVAYHEVGHAMIARLCDPSEPVHKISILPRGMALGYTLQLPEQDKYLRSKSEIKNKIRVLLGGRVAEDIIFGDITSGASNDIERATEMARQYVCQFGMSEVLGVRKYGRGSQQVFLGRDYSDHSNDYSNETAALIDTEIRRLIDDAYQDTKALLTQYRDALVTISEVILTKEVIDGDEFLALFSTPESADISDTSRQSKTKSTRKPLTNAKDSSTIPSLDELTHSSTPSSDSDD